MLEALVSHAEIDVSSCWNQDQAPVTGTKTKLLEPRPSSWNQDQAPGTKTIQRLEPRPKSSCWDQDQASASGTKTEGQST
ncbi:hypothetical protein PCANC_26541 [Puccinia coronata f. sp. avenae]|uniref:Uncharacterized protein n=1 Tax=Puccinia coronata f. sp. avenae TaxID=200324 RepID=A0A2N5SD10_9BASI|nr:hypothetical protein PCASD_23836 [Puccinia coronata f. sp. avenae]PLW28304.1 hypothetical protein PCANC_26541 [Puccinia coronata f. sp. avenae]